MKARCVASVVMEGGVSAVAPRARSAEFNGDCALFVLWQNKLAWRKAAPIGAAATMER